MINQSSDTAKAHSKRPQTPYIAFLVRSWQEGSQRRYLLEKVGTREKHGFDSLDALFVCIQE